MSAARALRVLAVAAALSSGCSGARSSTTAPEPHLKVVDLRVGRTLGADKRVQAPSTTFGPSDVVYASVETDGHARRAVLAARWTFQGALLEETEQTIAPDGKAVSEFHVANPSGWAPGEYQVQILIDGRAVADRTFRVESAS